MEAYRVDLSPGALEQIESAFYYIEEQSPQNAKRWLQKLYDEIDTLESMPERFGLIAENDAFDIELRELVHFSHRVIFTVDHANKLVKVVAVRHGARDDLPESDV